MDRWKIDFLKAPKNALDFDGNLGTFYPGELIVLGGEANSAISVFALNIALNLPCKSLYFSTVEAENEVMATLNAYCSNMFWARSNQATRLSDLLCFDQKPEDCESAYDATSHGDIEVRSSDSSFSCKDIEDMLLWEKDDHDEDRTKVVFVDYLQALKSPDGPTDIEQAAAINILTLKKMAQKYRVCIVVLSQLVFGHFFSNHQAEYIADVLLKIEQDEQQDETSSGLHPYVRNMNLVVLKNKNYNGFPQTIKYSFDYQEGIFDRRH